MCKLEMVKNEDCLLNSCPMEYGCVTECELLKGKESDLSAVKTGTNIEISKDGLKIDGVDIEVMAEKMKEEKQPSKELKVGDKVFKHTDNGGIYFTPTPKYPVEDIINKPNHYHLGGIDIYEIMQAKMTPEEYKGFCKGNVLKYLLRADLKGKAVEDLKKLRFNADRAIEAYEGIKYVPEHKKQG